MPPRRRRPRAASASRPATSRTRRDMALRGGARRGPQGVADAPGRVDQRRSGAVQLLAQVGDVGLEHAGVSSEIVFPDVVEDLRAREHAPRVQHEEAQQAVLRGGEVHGLPGAADLARLLVELEVLEDEAARVGLRQAGAAEDRPDPGDELLEGERLRDVVVTAHREPADLVLGRVAGGEEDDREAGALGAEAARHLEALHVGEHDVKDHEVGPERGHRLQGGGAVPGGLHLEALIAEGHRDDVGDVRFVVDDEDALRFAHALSVVAEPVSFLSAAWVVPARYGAGTWAAWARAGRVPRVTVASLVSPPRR